MAREASTGQTLVIQVTTVKHEQSRGWQKHGLTSGWPYPDSKCWLRKRARDNIKNSLMLKQHEEVIQSLLMLSRKAITVKWVGDDPSSVFMWKSLISEVVTLEKLGHYINGRIHSRNGRDNWNILELNTIWNWTNWTHAWNGTLREPDPCMRFTRLISVLSVVFRSFHLWTSLVNLWKL